MRADTITLQQIWRMGYTAYACKHRLPDYVRRAVWAIFACRTALLGGHVQACPEGHLERIWDNSCRHRLCPQCAWIQIACWIVKQQARLLACDHDHAIFTRPPELHALWLANVDAMSRLLCASVHDTLLELLGDGQYLGARPGIIATRHTWSPTLILHPPLHCLVTGGGLKESGQGVAVRNGLLLPMRVVRAVFRGKLRAAMRQGVAQGTLKRPEGKSRQPVEHLLHKLGRTKWNVHLRERSPHGRGVLVSLARYLRGGPIAPQRLVSCEGQHVVFRYDERAKTTGGQAHPRTMRLPLEHFIGRWLLHGPPARAVRVRCWGLYAHTPGVELAWCRQQVSQGPRARPELLDGPREGEGGGEEPPECCPVCGQPLVCVALVPRAGAPPPGAVGWEQVA